MMDKGSENFVSAFAFGYFCLRENKMLFLQYGNDEDEVFIGRDLAHAHSYSEGIASAIDVEVKRIIDESYEKAKTIIAEHRDVLDRCAALLLEKEKITREEFEALFEA